MGGSRVTGSSTSLCVLISFLLKSFILKYRGIRAYRKAVPFFLGLALGDFLMGFSWFILGMVLNIPTYTFWM